MNKNDIINPIEFDESIRKKSVEFSIPGKPRGKERPRMARRGNFVTTYTPKNTVDYENLVRMSYRLANKNLKLSDIPIEADITAIFPVPSSTSKKRRKEIIESKELHTTKPDCDNIAKIILDALNKVAYNDDSQVSRIIVEKHYGEEPRVNVKLKELNPRKEQKLWQQ